MTKIFGYLLKGLAALALLLLITSATLLFIAFSNEPIPHQQTVLNASSAKATETLLRRLTTTLLSKEQPRSFHAHETEIRSSLQFISKAWKPLSTHAQVNSDGLALQFFINTPKTPLGDHLRFSLIIPSSTEGLTASRLHIDKLSIPGNWLLQLIITSVDGLLKDSTVREMVNSVIQVHIQRDQAVFILDPPRDIRSKLNQLSYRLKGLSGDLNLFSETALTRYYFTHLLTIEKQFSRGEHVELEQIIQPLFMEVQRKSTDDNAVEHNRSALFALGVYLGSYHFEKFIGTIAPKDYKAHLQPINVTLSGRKDLRLHFVYSSTLQLLSDQGASFTVGEFKELLDSNTEGSGFSFVDLAADRAGIKFASLATTNPHTAREFQYKIVLGIEKGLLPPLTHLKEGLSIADFEQHYTNIESAQYADEVSAIDDALSTMPVFQP